MKTNLLPSLAVALGLSFCANAQGQTTNYQAPAKWNSFNSTTASSNFFTASAQVGDDAAKEVVEEHSVEELPIPAFIPAEGTPFPTAAAPAPPAPASSAGCGPCGSTSPYAAAASAPWGGCDANAGLPGISPWFGGAELLFFDVANDSYGRNLAIGDANGIAYLNTNDVDPSGSVGFSAHFGRYIKCGQYAWDVQYFLFNPDEETTISRPAVAGDYRAAITGWNNATVNPGGGAASAYSFYDGAAAHRARRDIFIQGIEANMLAFGIMGARRVGACGSNGFGRTGYYGGRGGPIARACSGRVQSQLSHGFRWFQLEDEFEYAADINATAGYQADDMYYNVDTENNLFGYQAGGQTTYCLHNRLNMGIGGKIGIYGNNAEVRHRLGTETSLAYLTAGGVDDVLTERSKTVLSALGELDLGLGYRINNAWSVRAGYRLLAACGVATSVGSIAEDYSSLNAIAAVRADDCLILHGGYAGMEFNY